MIPATLALGVAASSCVALMGPSTVAAAGGLPAAASPGVVMVTIWTMLGMAVYVCLVESGRWR